MQGVLVPHLPKDAGLLGLVREAGAALGGVVVGRVTLEGVEIRESCSAGGLWGVGC